MKTWRGPTPQYDEPHLIANDVVDRNTYRRQGFHDAMNSPEVRAMHEALRYILYHQYYSDNQIGVALAAYEVGLKEQDGSN